MCGITIVSGLADGIDAATHKGAIAGGGKTAAVMATGHDRVYPTANHELYENILKTGGVVVSEYYPECKINKSSFVIQNRIVSGLSYGTLIIEAGEPSGALATAGHTQDQNRDLFALPGNITSPASAGTNKLIKSNAAQLVTEPTDIVAEYIRLYPEKLYTNAKPILQRSELAENEGKVAALLAFGGEMSHKLLMQICGLNEKELDNALSKLIQKGMATKLPGGRYRETEGEKSGEFTDSGITGKS